MDFANLKVCYALACHNGLTCDGDSDKWVYFLRFLLACAIFALHNRSVNSSIIITVIIKTIRK